MSATTWSSRNLFDLSGRVALVTGASRGIGRAIAEGLAGAGSGVALASRTQADLVQCADALRRETGVAVEIFPTDTGQVGVIRQLVQDVLDRMGQIDILVNVAGVNRRVPAVEITEEDWDAVTAVNLKGVFFTAQAVGRYWLETDRFAEGAGRGKGKIINIASLTSRIGIPRIAAYAASKSGVLGITRTLAVEWATRGICVNALAPGYVETPMTRPLFEDPARSAWIHSRIPMGRRGYPGDLVGTAVFLASAASDYLTGQAIYVDGGWLAG